jgi:putative ABC transport system permease protein
VFNDNDLSAFFLQPDAILIGDATASRYNLTTDSRVTFRVGDRRKTMRVIGVIKPIDEDSRRALDGLAIMDIGAAQQLFGMNGKISHIDLIADERTEQGKAILEKVRNVLPDGAQIVKPKARSQSVESLTDAFRLNLTALSLLALVVGMFLIYNTITFSVVQRRPIIGTLRCLGVTQTEIFRMILTETLLLGVVGGAIGVALGVVLGQGAVALVTQTINDLYYVVNVRSVNISPLILLKGFVLGLIASLVAALAPAYEATSIPPISALKRSNVESRARRVLPFVALAGVVSFFIGAVLLLSVKLLVANLGGIFFVLIGVALVSPMLTIVMMRLASPLLSRVAGVIGRMSARSVVNAISRTAIAIASLMVAVSVIIGLQSMIGSFRKTVESWLESTLTADIYIAPPATAGTANVDVIDAEVVEQFRQTPGVSEATLFRRATVAFEIENRSQTSETTLLAVDSNRERPPENFVWASRDTNDLWRSMIEKDEVWVSEPFANKHGVTRENNRVMIRTDKGSRAFTVVAVYYDYASDAGVILMRRDAYRKFFGDDSVSSVALYLEKDERDVRAFATKLREIFAGRELVISANRELRQNALQIFDRTFAITGALNLLATVVAFIGVLSALMALQIERTRELGTLRANGMTLRQLWKLTLMETGLMGGAAGLMSMPTGLLLALILVYIINLRSFGWTIRLSLDWQTFAQAMIVAVASALLAAIYPMLRLAKIQIAQAVRQE